MKDIMLYEQILAQDKNFPIRILDNDGKTEVSAHWHEHLEILFFRTGGHKVGCAGNVIDVEVNDTVVVNSNEIHYIEKQKNMQYFCVIISPSFFYDINFEDVMFKQFIKDDEEIKKCFVEIYLEYTLHHEGYDMAIKSIAYRLIAYLLRNYKVERLKSASSSHNKRTQRITEILRYIDEHYSERLTTFDLAKKFYLNEQYFCQLFKKATGQSPVMYINRYRVEKAGVLLKNTELSITEIAMNVGFDNANYFARIFRKHMGMNPREYAKQK